MSKQAAVREFTSDLPPFNLPRRLKQLRNVMHNAGVDGLVVSSPQVCRYAVGTSSAVALLALDPLRAFAYQLPSPSPIKLSPELQSLVQPQITPDPVADAAAALRHCSTVGFEADALTYESFTRLKELLPEDVTFRKIGKLATSVSAGRDPGEVARTEAAARIVANALDSASGHVRSLSEAELAAKIDSTLRDHGAREVLQRGQRPQIRTYVAYGSNADDVTHSPGSAVLHADELAVLSAGAVVDGYWAVETRTLGTTKDPTMVALRRMVEDLFEYVRALLKGGQSLDDACQKTMELLRETGLVSLAPHAPCFSIGMQLGDPLCTGGGDRIWTACIEPGLYLPGKGGVRIGRTEAITGSARSHPASPALAAPLNLTSATPYFRAAPPALADFPDGHTAFLIGDVPGTWEGGV